MNQLSLTKQQTIHFILSHQGLWPPYQLEGKTGALTFIRRVGCIQFDPLNIVGHNQELVLQSRVANFQPSFLKELLYQDRMLLDGWDKNMSIYPTEDWPYFQRVREAARKELGDAGRPASSILPQVRQKFEDEGPLSSKDLDYDQAVEWSWAPTRLSRAALESMYFWGELIIHHKIHTRKIYDLAKRHISESVLQAPDPNTSEEQYHEWYILRRISSLGLLWNKAGDAWLRIAGLKSPARIAAFTRLKNQEKVIEVNVDGINVPLYMRYEDKPELERVMEKEQTTSQASILAPLDNLLWERRLVKELFHFDYRWEVYKPAVERRYGYYVLPVLYGDRFVARFEPGRDRKNRLLLIKNWWWEPGIIQTEKMQAELLCCFCRFARFAGVNAIQVNELVKKQEELDWLTFDSQSQ